MGDYAEVSICLAESDFHPEERAFMDLLWDRVYGPEKSIGWGPSDAYQRRYALYDEAHADLGLPGKPWDWKIILPREVDGRRYYLPLGSLPGALIPPFPRRFARIYQLREKYGIKPMWYAMFTAADRNHSGSKFTSTIGAVRKQFAENFRGVWQFLFAGYDGPGREALMKAAPADSEEKESIGRFFERFPFVDYLAVLEYLAEDWGRDALIELDFGSILYNYDRDDDKATGMVRAEWESARRVFEAFRRVDFPALCGESILDLERSYPAGGVFHWLVPYQHIGSVDWMRREFFGFQSGTEWFNS